MLYSHGFLYYFVHDFDWVFEIEVFMGVHIQF